MSSAYAHKIAPMAQLINGKPLAGCYRKAHQVPHWNQAKFPGVQIWTPNCSGRACNERPIYASEYLYVTGRAGRVTSRNQYWCKTHGEAWAKRHNVELAAVTLPETP